MIIDVFTHHWPLPTLRIFNPPALKPPHSLQAPTLLTHNLLSRAGLSKQSMIFSNTPLTAANTVRNLPALFSHFLQIHLHKAFFSDKLLDDSVHKYFLNQTTLDLRKEKLSYLNQDLTVPWLCRKRDDLKIYILFCWIAFELLQSFSTKISIKIINYFIRFH